MSFKVMEKWKNFRCYNRSSGFFFLVFIAPNFPFEIEVLVEMFGKTELENRAIYQGCSKASGRTGKPPRKAFYSSSVKVCQINKRNSRLHWGMHGIRMFDDWRKFLTKTFSQVF